MFGVTRIHPARFSTWRGKIAGERRYQDTLRRGACAPLAFSLSLTSDEEIHTWLTKNV
jgi:hypothetical protein